MFAVVATSFDARVLLVCLAALSVVFVIYLTQNEKQKARAKEVQRLLSEEITSLKAQIANLKRKR
jgi:hypothetical protein